MQLANASHRAYMEQYSPYWKDLKYRIDKTKYAHLDRKSVV